MVPEEFHTFNRIVIPIMKPAIAVQGDFYICWFLEQLLCTGHDHPVKSKMTVPILIATLRGADYMNFDMGKIYMMITVAIVPIIVVYLLLSKYIIAGVTLGGVKRVMAFTQFKHSGTLNPEISVCEKKHSSFAEKAAEEGIVLLKNENILPISLSASVALLGIGADKTVKRGIGSGDVNNRQNITIYEGMEESGIRITGRDWLDDYEHRYQKARLIWKEKILEEAKHVK